MAIRLRGRDRLSLGEVKGGGITGIGELDAKLKKLGDRQFRKTTRKASNKAMTPMVKATKRNVHKRTGLLKKSIGKKQKTYKTAGVILTIVGARTGFKDAETGEDPAKIAHLIEFGVQPHAIQAGGVVLSDIGTGADGEVFGSSVNHPGFAGFSFQRKAFDSTKSQTMSVYIREMKAGIDQEAKKA